MAKKRRRNAHAGRAPKPDPPPGRTAAAAAAPARFASARNLALAAAIVALTAWVYAPVRTHDFVDLDDGLYVTDNAMVAGGLTWAGVRWAFTTGHAANWHPLTWLSHMLDVELFGPDAGAHHVASVVLHAAAALVLFWLLAALTGAPGRSAAVAALFAIHPLHVESVAWIAERKDVLSTLLGFLAVAAWVGWVRHRGAARYLAAAALVALGLLAKPMLVTLPFVLLLLDVWPLRRAALEGGFAANLARWRPLIVEKLPLFALAAASSVATYLVQQRGGAVNTLEVLPFAARAANAVTAYAGYLAASAWPSGLAVFYPHPRDVAFAAVAGAGVALGALTVLAIRLRRTRPYFFTGWFWYAGTLVPVIGLVQVGTQAMADRYTYVPLVGVFLAVVWGLADLARGRPVLRRALPAAAAAAIVALAVAARGQVAHWENSLTLWTRAVEATTGNARAHNSLGAVLGNLGRHAEAAAEFEAALRLAPDAGEAAHARHNLGRALAETGRFADALPHYREALRLRPEFAEAHNNLGFALASMGLADEAIARYRDAVRLDPNLAEAHNNLGFALASRAELDEAVAALGEAVRLRPGFERARLNLGMALAALGRTEAASAEFAEVLKINPGNEWARRALDDLARRRRGGG